MRSRLPTLNSNISIKKKWNINKYSLGVGQYFDISSYSGCFRHAIFGLLGIFFGMHGDALFFHLNLVFGFGYAIPTPGLIQWHSRIGAVIGGWAFLIGSMNFYMVYRRRVTLSRPLFYEKKTKVEALVNRFPLLHDLTWGWPLLVAISLIYFTHPVDALYGIFFGGIAYALNHYISKKPHIPIWLKVIFNLSFGGLAIWGWLRISIAFNGFPDGWQDIPVLPIF